MDNSVLRPILERETGVLYAKCRWSGTVASDSARVPANLFHFERELVRCNTGAEPAGPRFDHSYLLVFTHEPR